MGHTLVARFDSESNDFLHSIMHGADANKIPFGRDCDRKAANEVMDYHLTLLHWAKTRDAYFLERIRDFQPATCRILVTDVQMMYAEEGSLLLYFAVRPTRSFRELTDALEEKTGAMCAGFLHITLAVSKDHGEIRKLHDRIRKSTGFPFELGIEGLDLYHIWKPTKKVRSY